MSVQNIKDRVFPAKIETVSLGFMILGSTGDPQTIANILLGHYDYELSVMIHQREYQSLPQKPEDIQADAVTTKLGRIKDTFRNMINGMMQQESSRLAALDRQEARAKAQRMHQARISFENMNKPAPEGTVAELAKKHGVSLKTIRRMKQEGRLHELTEGTKQ